MRDALELFDKTMEDYGAVKNLQNHLMDLIENLYQDLENERNSNTKLQEEIVALTKKESFALPSKFATLKADYVALKEKISSLKNENEDLNIQLIAKNQESDQSLVEKEKELTSYYQLQLKEKDELLQEKERQIVTTKEHFKEKEHELYKEVHTAEMSTALQIDSIQEDFKKQLNESNKRLKESMETCNNLRRELMSVKEQFNEHKRNSCEKISELQRRLKDPQCGEPAVNCIPDIIFNNDNDDLGTKYQPLDIHLKQYNEKPINLKKTTISRTFSKSRNSNNALPPLIDLKVQGSSNKDKSKKRKLFNPEDLSYLSEEMDY